MTDTYAPLGSISSGTMRIEDLIEPCLNALRPLDRRAAIRFAAEFDELDLSTDDDREQAEMMLFEDVFDALDSYSPPYCYFGANEGDGSDIGWWLSHDAFEDACRDGEVLKVSDLSEVPTKLDPEVEYVAVVNDHGNLTLYAATDLEHAIYAIV